MKILLLTPGFPADDTDSNCIPALQLFVRGLLRRGAQVQVIALEYPFKSRRYTWHGGPDALDIPPATVYPCNGQNRLWHKPYTLAQARYVADKIIEKEGIAVLHSFWLGWAAYIGEQASLRSGLPHFTTLMGQDVLPENHRRLRRLAPERFSRLIALSNFHNAMLEKTTGRRAAHTIPWGVDKKEWKGFWPQHVDETIDTPVDILGVGSLLPVKNWDLWLHTLSLAAQRQSAISAELIGDGPERSRLERLAVELGLEGRVHFAGNQPRSQVLARMQAAKVLLHTARFESFGYVLTEAAMAGCRLVATPVGIAPELGAALGSDVEILASQLLRALDAPPLAGPVMPFGMEDTVEKYWELYKK